MNGRKYQQGSVNRVDTSAFLNSGVKLTVRSEESHCDSSEARDSQPGFFDRGRKKCYNDKECVCATE